VDCADDLGVIDLMVLLRMHLQVIMKKIDALSPVMLSGKRFIEVAFHGFPVVECTGTYR
jgi:hypothetical protein